MDEVLIAMRTGRLSFKEFEKRTRPVWTNIARSLLRRWKGPIAVTDEDLLQELILHAWIFAGHWTPGTCTANGQPVTIGRYVTFNAIDKAKKWLHQQRNAYRRDDRSSGRMEKPVSSMNLTEYAEEHLFDDMAHMATQEDLLAERETVLALATRADPEHRPALAALARTGDLELAALQLRQSSAACVALRLETLADARHAVSRALHSLA